MILLRRAALAVLVSAMTSPLAAQVFPTRAAGPVTDDAEIIDAAAETALNDRLTALAADSGARVEVVTLPSMALYTMGEEIAAYAGMLAADYDLPATAEGKWALLLVFADDRELRLETGPAYAGQADAVAAIVDGTIIPAFADGDPSAGITAGIEALVTQVVAPAPAAPAAEGGGSGLIWFGGAVAALIGGVVLMIRRNAARLATTPCPSCGKTGLTRAQVTLTEATVKSEGRGETRTTCPSCGHVTAVPFTIARKTPEQSAKADDRPQGGGATGRW